MRGASLTVVGVVVMVGVLVVEVLSWSRVVDDVSRALVMVVSFSLGEGVMRSARRELLDGEETAEEVVDDTSLFASEAEAALASVKDFSLALRVEM